MTMLKKLFVVLTSTLALFASGCATTDGPLTTEQRIARCGAMLVGGAVLGSFIGNNIGSGSAGDGALIGAAIGGGACAVWLSFQNEADRERMLATQQQAAATGMPQRARWTGTDGRQRMVSVVPGEAKEFAGASEDEPMRVCRSTEVTASVGNVSDTMSEIVCRVGDGDYYVSEDQTLVF